MVGGWLHWWRRQKSTSCSSLATLGACFTHTQGQGHGLVSGSCRAGSALNLPVQVIRDTFQEKLCRGLGRDTWLWQWQIFTWGWWQWAMPPSEGGARVLHGGSLGEPSVSATGIPHGKTFKWLLIAEAHCRLRRICSVVSSDAIPHHQKGRKSIGCAWNSCLSFILWGRVGLRLISVKGMQRGHKVHGGSQTF